MKRLLLLWLLSAAAASAQGTFDWLTFPTGGSAIPEVQAEWKCESSVLTLYTYTATAATRAATNITCNPNPAVDANGNGAPAPNSMAAPVNAYTLPYRELGVIPFTSTPVTPQVSCFTAADPTAFTLDRTNGLLTRSDICTAQVIAPIKVISRPSQVRITPDGSTAIVTSYDNGITFIDTSTNQISAILQPVIFASGVAIASDGSYALVTNYDDAAPYLAIVDIPSQSITGKIPLDLPFPQSVFLNPDSTLAWVTYPASNTVEAIDMLSGTVTRSLSINSPCDVVFNPTGTTAYVSSGAGSIQIIDTATYSTTSSVKTAAGTCDIQISADGHLVTANNYLAGSTTVFDARTPGTAVTIPGGTKPHGSVLVPVQ